MSLHEHPAGAASAKSIWAAVRNRGVIYSRKQTGGCLGHGLGGGEEGSAPQSSTSMCSVNKNQINTINA